MKLLEHKKINNNLGIIHFVGAGGIGISGMAEIMHNLGYKVQGSDMASNANTSRLSNLGIKIFTTHDISNIEHVEYIVISSAIKDDNIELIAARKRKIPIIKRAQMLAELLKLKTAIAISGTHGKTTTTSQVAAMFEKAERKPTVINGGSLNNRSTNAYLGEGDFVIAEADESDATFINIPSTIAVITNIDPEHLDYYGNFDNLKDAFRKFITNLPFYGFAVVCIDHPEIRNLVSDITDHKVITKGIDSEDAEVRAYKIRQNITSSTYDVAIEIANEQPQTFYDINIPIPGRHNVLNSLSAIAIAYELNFDDEVIRHGFSNFGGVKRRFTKVGVYNDVTIFDDFALHPTDFKAT